MKDILLEEAYEQVLVNESIASFAPYIPIVVNQLNVLHNMYAIPAAAEGKMVDPQEAIAILTSCITLITLALGGFVGSVFRSNIVRVAKWLRHWLLAKGTKIDVEQLEVAANEAKEKLKKVLEDPNPAKKGNITKWVNKLKVAAKNKDSAAMHEAAEHLKELCK